MDANELLAWARGPGFDITDHLRRRDAAPGLEVISLGKEMNLSAPRGSGVEGSLRTLLARPAAQGGNFDETAADHQRIRAASGFFIVLFMYGPAYRTVQSSLDSGWPALQFRRDRAVGDHDPVVSCRARHFG